MSVEYINEGVDLNALSELHRKNSPQNRCPEVMEWQYNSHKSQGSTIFAAVDDKKGIVGSQGAIFYKLLVSGKEVNSFKGEATLIEPDSRNKVDFLVLYQSCIDYIKNHNCELFWGITPIPKLFSTFGAKNLGNLYSTGILPLNPNGMIDLYQQNVNPHPKKKSLYQIVSFFHFILFYPVFKLTLINKRLPETIEVFSELKNGNDIISLHLKFDSKYKDQIFLYQDSEMIRWRLDLNPAKKTHKFFLYNVDELRGYCYLQENDTNLEILEMMFLDLNLIKPLIKHLVVNLNKGFSSLTIMINPENEIAKTISGVLKTSGFWFIKNKAAFTVMPMNRKLKYPESDASKWFLSGLWREGV